MKAVNKKWLAVSAALAFSGASAVAAPFTFNAQNFIVNPTAVGEPFGPFTAGSINFDYISEVDQFAGTGSGVGATSPFNETGVAKFTAFLTGVGGTPLGVLDTGLNLSSSTTTGYHLYALFSGAGSTTNTPVNIHGTFSSFNVTFYVDKNNDTTFGTAADAAGEGTIQTRTGGFGEDVSVLTGTLNVGEFNVNNSLAAGDFQVIFNVTGFGTAPGFFSTTTPGGQPLALGDINGVNTSITNVSAPPTAFVDGTIIGSGNVTFQAAVVPEPASLALVGLALAGMGLSRRKTRA